MFDKITHVLSKIFSADTYLVFLRIRKIRFLFVKYRYLFLKKNLYIKNDGSSNIGKETIAHNMRAFDTDAAFGCGGRMGLLIYPIVAFFSFLDIDVSKKKVLIVGCRTEDDIYWMKSYGFKKTLGFDLISYSKHVLVGDIHHTDFADNEFDIILLGWMLSYTKSPDTVIRECRRILKDGGLLGMGIEHNPKQENSKIGTDVRVNPLNSTAEMISVLDATNRHKVVFEYDHLNDRDNDFSTVVISQCFKQ